MMNTELKLNRQPDGRYIVTVDGGSIECATFGAALDIVRRETGDKAESAEWEKLKTDLESLTAAMVEMTADRDKYKNWWYKSHIENEQLKKAIVNCFKKEYAK